MRLEPPYFVTSPTNGLSKVALDMHPSQSNFFHAVFLGKNVQNKAAKVLVTCLSNGIKYI